jgi:hypothetical protein
MVILGLRTVPKEMAPVSRVANVSSAVRGVTSPRNVPMREVHPYTEVAVKIRAATPGSEGKDPEKVV